MIGGGRDVVFLQQLCDFFCFLTASYINDGATRNSLQNMHQLGFLISGNAHNVSQVLAFEAHSEHVFLAEGQTLLDIVNHFMCGSCGECQDGSFGFYFSEVGDL